jgi:hypothetical protein
MRVACAAREVGRAALAELLPLIDKLFGIPRGMASAASAWPTDHPL